MNVAVKMIHPYSEWVTPSGLTVQVGSGISQRQLLEAQAFIADSMVAGVKDAGNHNDERNVDLSSSDSKLVLSKRKPSVNRMDWLFGPNSVLGSWPRCRA